MTHCTAGGSHPLPEHATTVHPFLGDAPQLRAAVAAAYAPCGPCQSEWARRASGDLGMVGAAVTTWLAFYGTVHYTMRLPVPATVAEMLRGGALRPATRAFLAQLKLSPVEVEPGAQAPMWDPLELGETLKAAQAQEGTLEAVWEDTLDGMIGALMTPFPQSTL